MNRPSFSVRLAGHPLVALVLFALYAAVVIGWWQGSLSGWLVVAGTLVALRTLAAVRWKRAYKAWRADWDGMTGNEAPTKKGGRVLIIFAALFVLAVPFLPRLPISDNLVAAVTILWSVACLYLALVLVRGIVRRIRKRRKANAEVAAVKAKEEPVTLLLGRAASSPSREAAQQELPEYCAALMRRGEGGT